MCLCIVFRKAQGQEPLTQNKLTGLASHARRQQLPQGTSKQHTQNTQHVPEEKMQMRGKWEMSSSNLSMISLSV